MISKQQIKIPGAVLPQLRIANGTIEVLKWVGLVLMTGDHVNKYLFNGTLPILFEAGRLALPIFVFVLAFNLSRPGQLEKGAYLRAMKRLAFVGAMASVPFISLGGLYAGWWPLNILFTLFVLTATAYLCDLRRFWAAALVFAVGGGVVEYWWPAILFGMAVWSYRKNPSILSASIAVASCAGLSVVNGNYWALAALPLLILAARYDLHIPRLSILFYSYYPLHLAVIWLVRIPMSHAGYLFFY
ncbi:TraX family protein [Hahella ganghwensis]|uniref:TraX family protein n=1 Tax=Hahella ganghwensis TaxID=286420 RepID=UPI000364206C|nr:TraX family protein [Hahella ganghwensis]